MDREEAQRRFDQMHPLIAEVVAGNRLSVPADLERFLTELFDFEDGQVRAYGTAVSNPSQQLKNKFGQATGARGGLLSLTVRNNGIHERAVRSVVDNWHNPNWARRVSSVLINFYDDEGQRWRAGTLVSEPGRPINDLVHERLSEDIGVELIDPAHDLFTPPADVEANPDIERIVADFSLATRTAGLHFGARHDQLVRTFVCSLATKRFVVLTGLSGSGKTQLALQFGRWLGTDQVLLVPVRPDWTGPEHLFGYEDALREPTENGRPWVVPPVLEFVLRAARAPDEPHLLLLDEMNLAHVERYFADALSGIESNSPVVPNLGPADDGWFLSAEGANALPFPENLFIVGTVNVDETTFAMSPKVLDRANTIEFRVETDALPTSLVDIVRPGLVDRGPAELVGGFNVVASDETYHQTHEAPFAQSFIDAIRRLHDGLAWHGFEFGHRTFYEGVRLASLLAAAGGNEREALDLFVLQKVLPRLHGSRRVLEPVLRVVGAFADDVGADLVEPTYDPTEAATEPQLPGAADKVGRMMRALYANQFASFWD